MRCRQSCSPRFRVSRSACSHSVKVSMRGDSTAAKERGGKAVNFEIPAAAPTTTVVLMKSRLVYFMVRVGSSYARRKAGAKFLLFLQNKLGTKKKFLPLRVIKSVISAWAKRRRVLEPICHRRCARPGRRTTLRVPIPAPVCGALGDLPTASYTP